MKSQIEQYFDRLWPINRSLTGDGNRETLKILSEIVNLEINEVPSGTTCFDWQVPPEWNVREAWIKDEEGNIIVDFAVNNLHLLGYSEPFEGMLTYDELRSHLYTLPEQPTLIPYLTSYYKRRWGFCMSHNQLEELDRTRRYQVLIDATLDEKGSMTIGEAFLQGNSDEEVFFSTYICHPSLGNNELSGPLVSAFIYNELSKRKNLRYSYRFLFLPETIGSIYYLSQMGEHLKEKLKAGFVITCIGDGGSFTYKKSRRGNVLSDRAAELVLSQTEQEYTIENFFPTGSDERQYCSPGFNLPVGSLMRTRYGKYPEYHTSADNKSIISFEAMEKSVQKYVEIIDVIEHNDYLLSTNPHCEPQLGKRGLYPTLGSQKEKSEAIDAILWVLNLSDGSHDLIEMAKISGHSYRLLIDVSQKLLNGGLLERMGSPIKI